MGGSGARTVTACTPPSAAGIGAYPTPDAITKALQLGAPSPQNQEQSGFVAEPRAKRLRRRTKNVRLRRQNQEQAASPQNQEPTPGGAEAPQLRVAVRRSHGRRSQAWRSLSF